MTPTDNQVEAVARAIYGAGIPKGGKYYHTWDDLESEGFYAQHDLAMKQARAALAALQPQDGWQDIATAPKDGIILLFVPNGLGGKPLVRQGEWHATELQEAGWLLHHGPELYARWKPTHWRPLPAPPAAELERTPKQDGLAELRALSEKATPGPWDYVDSVVWIATHDNQGDPVQQKVADTGDEADAAFIAAAVNHVRAEIERTKGIAQ